MSAEHMKEQQPHHHHHNNHRHYYYYNKQDQQEKGEYDEEERDTQEGISSLLLPKQQKKQQEQQEPQHGLDEKEEEQQQPHVSSRLPMPAELLRAGAWCLVGTGMCVVLVSVAVFVWVCVVLARANVPEVHAACGGFWDFMLASVVSPAGIPIIYGLLWVCCQQIPWDVFASACYIVLGVACLHMSLTAAENGPCVEALRRTSPPFPWLLYLGFIKAALFTASAISASFVRFKASPPPSQQ